MLHQCHHLLRKNPVRKKTNAAKAVVHAVKAAVRVAAKVAAVAAEVAEAVTVLIAAKAVVNAPSAVKAGVRRALPNAATHAPVSVKSATLNAATTEAKAVLSAVNVLSAAKAAAHAKNATVVTAKAVKVQATARRTHLQVWTPVQKHKPKCAPRPVASASLAKSGVKKPPQKTVPALRDVASAAHAAKAVAVSVPHVKKTPWTLRATYP